MLFFYARHRKEEDYVKTVRRVDDNEKYLAAAMSHIVRCLHAIDNKLRVLESGLLRLVLVSEGLRESSRLIEENVCNDNAELLTLMQELALFSRDDDVRLSAYRQLATSFGDIASLEMAEMVAGREPDGEVRELAAHYTRILRKRLHR